MNNKGFAGLWIVFAIFYFFVGMILYQYVKPDIDTARAVDQMNCVAPLTAGDKVICLIFDAIIPILILGIVSVAGGIITEKGFV